MAPTLLFIRDYRAFQGGHLKVADYIAHTRASGLFTPRLFMTRDSRSDHPFPRDALTPDWRPDAADALFVAGMDWAYIPPRLEERRPVINLIQHPRHALTDDPRFGFLRRRALRICVSQQVADRVLATGRANGPVHVIPAGLDLNAMPAARGKTVDVLICGLKQPGLAQAVAGILRERGVTANVLTAPIPRGDYLAMLASARIAITLPDAEEGCYLPALEAMAAGCGVICPDALGNRGFCRDGDTCLMPPPVARDLAEAAFHMLADPDRVDRLALAGSAEARRHGLDGESSAFGQLLATLARQEQDGGLALSQA